MPLFEPKSGWFSSGGKPARCMTHGWPSYETDDGFAVMDLLVVMDPGFKGRPRMFSRWYNKACALAPEGLVPGHVARSRHATVLVEPAERTCKLIEFEAPPWCQYRPVLYELHLEGGWCGLGSQGELSWRYGLWWMINALAGLHKPEGKTYRDLAEEVAVKEELVEAFDMADADERARALLLEMLTPQQRLELAAAGRFRVRGAKTRRIYGIEPGNGFVALDELGSEALTSYCLHTEHWIPDADVALATKFALEDRELEEECVAGAKARPLHSERRLPAGPAERRLHDMERALIR